ncbi:MAG: tRNA uridine-5-carboxymethylaminomethyl(34) synthesis GTPase MnmE [Saccharofermentanales bacterium]|jgi:tRNA modification GTPase|nr:tRNA uridine-5-carboxymethylaminomethyl(34) synthesis GTPase MnmE [Bacillota bacterium]
MITKAITDTIAAVSTPPGASGLAVLRLSGPQAAECCDHLFQPYAITPLRPSEMAGYTTAVGTWAGLDEVVLSCFKAPNSFTGEDVFEISCHGGTAVKQAILDSLISVGARLAEPGEFSKRAFVNGKMDLSQAEAVMDLIGAEASRQVQAAFKQLKGQLSGKIRTRADALYELMARVEVILEFPELEETPPALEQLAADTASEGDKIRQLALGYGRGKVVREGLRVAIAGRPNAGKSTLLNNLVGEDKAIVTPIPGTTRDLVEAHLIVDGYLVLLTDTAGLTMDTADPVEQEGVRRARLAHAEADLLFWLISPPLPAAEEFEREMAEIRDIVAAGKDLVLVLGKDDRGESAAIQDVIGEYLTGVDIVRFSQQADDGAKRIKDKISDHLRQLERQYDQDTLITHERHRKLLEDAAAELTQAATEIRSGLTLDLVATRLRQAAELLAEMTGDSVDAGLVDTIFSRFCVGK